MLENNNTCLLSFPIRNKNRDILSQPFPTNQACLMLCIIFTSVNEQTELLRWLAGHLICFQVLCTATCYQAL